MLCPSVGAQIQEGRLIAVAMVKVEVAEDCQDDSVDDESKGIQNTVDQ